MKIKKGRDREIESYSAFFDNAKGSSTGLADALHGRNVSDVFVCGLATDVCVGKLKRERQAELTMYRLPSAPSPFCQEVGAVARFGARTRQPVRGRPECLPERLQPGVVAPPTLWASSDRLSSP